MIRAALKAPTSGARSYARRRTAFHRPTDASNFIASQLKIPHHRPCTFGLSFGTVTHCRLSAKFRPWPRPSHAACASHSNNRMPLICRRRLLLLHCCCCCSSGVGRGSGRASYTTPCAMVRRGRVLLARGGRTY